MKNILVPIDFSEPSKHAARYAIAFAQHMHAYRIILYNAYQQPMPTDPMLIEPTMNAMEIYNVTELGEISKEHLARFTDELRSEVPASLQIESIGEFNDLTEGIIEVSASRMIDLVVTGITIGDKLTETLVGSHAIDIAKQITTPVLIVPPDADYQPVKNILFACDYKKVAETTPVLPLKNILTETGAHLHVLHVNESDSKADNLQAEMVTLKNLLQSEAPEFHVVQNADFAEAINAFTKEHGIDMVVAIPKKHGFFSGLFHKSHIKMLAFHTHTPLLLMHDDK